MKEFSEQLLRRVVEEADQKKQKGLFIWLSVNIWDDIRDIMREGNEHYDFALTQVSEEKDATITVKWFGITLPVAFAVPVQKMKNVEEYFQTIMNICEDKGRIGPITFIPNNEIAECFE